MNAKKQKNIEAGIQAVQFVLTLVFVFWAYRWMQKEENGYEARIVLGGFIFQLVPPILYFLIKIKAKHEKKALLKKYNRQKISSELLEEELSDVPRVSVVGIGSVGKTTLIESICQKIHQDSVTYGMTSYVFNFSDRFDHYAVLLDATGQSMSAQNDNALKSKMLIIILDHDESKLQRKPNQLRLEDHKRFLILLKERLQTSNHVPVWMHFLLNKSDLWGKSTRREATELKHFFSEQVKIFQDIYPMMEITYDFHSNNQTNDCSKLVSKIAQHLN